MAREVLVCRKAFERPLGYAGHVINLNLFELPPCVCSYPKRPAPPPFCSWPKIHGMVEGRGEGHPYEVRSAEASPTDSDTDRS